MPSNLYDDYDIVNNQAYVMIGNKGSGEKGINDIFFMLMSGSNKLVRLSLSSLYTAVMKHYSLLVPFISYEEDEVLLIRSLELYSQHFIFFVYYEWGPLS
jgi:hypothetical protein